jgi:hypothetical protein
VNPNLRAKCRRLLETGALPRSQCGVGFIRCMKPLFDAGVVRWEKSAAGQKLNVLNRVAYEGWFTQHFPGTKISSDFDSSRIQGIAHFRDSKAVRSNLPVTVCVRSTQDGVLLQNGLPVETTRPTIEHGLFAFLLVSPTTYSLKGTCVLIENLAVFTLFERLNLDVHLAIWTSGVTSNRFLDWLVLNVQHGQRFLHLPDYDPVGMVQFLRYQRRLGDAVSLHLPINMPFLFKKFSKAPLLLKRKSQRMLLRLRKAQHPDVQRVVVLMDEHNGGLEHEALFITEDASKVAEKIEVTAGAKHQ